MACRSTRISALAISAIACMLVAGVASAQTFSMTGRAATGSGAFVDLPAAGNQACPSLTGKIGFGPGFYPAPMTNTMLIGPLPLNPGGCIPGGPAKVVVNMTGGFTVPAGFFLQPFPGGTMGGTAMDLNVTTWPFSLASVKFIEAKYAA